MVGEGGAVVGEDDASLGVEFGGDVVAEGVGGEAESVGAGFFDVSVML